MNSQKPDWNKGNGLLPAIVQDAHNLRVLMLGYMNEEALEQTLKTGRVTFFSRSKNRLWVKGETSGHFLDFVSLEMDCDQDTILIQANPKGPVCHIGSQTCFNDKKGSALMFLKTLASLIQQRNQKRLKGSYTTELFEKGKSRMAQKVGEEGVELALACMKEDQKEMTHEAADLIFHVLVLLESAKISLYDVCNVLMERHKKK